MPTEETWSRIRHNFKVLQELHDSIFKKCLQGKKFPNLTNEMTMIRRETWSNLFMNDPTNASPITSLSDAEMDPELAKTEFMPNWYLVLLWKTFDQIRLKFW